MKRTFCFLLVLFALLISAKPVFADYAVTLGGNSTNQYVSIPGNSSLDMGSSYTIEAWIKPYGFNYLAGIVSQYTNGPGYILRLIEGGNYRGINFDGMFTADDILDANTWYHIAAVNSGGTHTLYINGVATALNGTAITPVNANRPVQIGWDWSVSGARFFNGLIDEVRIWNVARSQAEVTDNMYATLTGSESGLAAYYRFAEGSGTAVEDLSTNSNDGILVNGPSWTANACPQFGGFGTAASPFLVEDKYDLVTLATYTDLWSKAYRQTADIAFSDADYTSGGICYNNGYGWPMIGGIAGNFTGVYDGDYHTVDNIRTSVQSGIPFSGFFGTTQNATVSNLGVTNEEINGFLLVGGLIGTMQGGATSNCYTTGSVTADNFTVGGLVGDSSGNISGSYSMCDVTGSTWVGGLVGSSSGTISNCFSFGSASGQLAGGLVQSNNGTITNCYSVAYLSAVFPGGLVQANSGTVTGSFWNTATSGCSISAAGTGLVSAQMLDIDEYVGAGWDFVLETANGTDDIWNIDGVINSGVPFLNWQGTSHTGPFTCSPTSVYAQLDANASGSTQLTITKTGATGVLFLAEAEAEPITQTVFSENFEGSFPGVWTVQNGLGTNTWCRMWCFNNYYILNGSYFAFVGGQNSSETMDEYLISPTINLSDCQNATLEFDQSYYYYTCSNTSVDVWDGTQWVQVLYQNYDVGDWTNSVPQHTTIDVSDYANSAFQVRFHFYSSQYNFWGVDNVSVSCQGYPCLHFGDSDQYLGYIRSNESQCVLDVDLSSRSLPNGLNTANLILMGGDAATTTVTVPITINVAEYYNTLLSPDSLDFGLVRVGDTQTESFTLVNGGNLSITGSVTTPEAFTLSDSTGRDMRNELTFTLAGGESCAYDLTFAPTVAQDYSGSVVITSNDLENPVLNLTVTAVGEMLPELTWSPTSQSLSMVCGTQATVPVTLGNTGNADMEYIVTPCSEVSDEMLETFDSGIPATWTIVNGGGSSATWYGCNDWHNLDGTPFAFVNSDDAGSVDMDESLISPVMDISYYLGASLSFDQNFSQSASSIADVDVWDGTQWVNVLRQTATSYAHQSIDVSAYMNSQFQVRFHYYNANWEWYWAIDNVLVSAYWQDVCPWATVDGEQWAGGTVAEGDEQILQVTLDADALSAGSYTVFVNVSTNDPAHSDVYIPINVTVIDAPTSLDAPQNVRVAVGTDSVTLSWDAVTNAAGYIVYSATSANGTFAEDTTGAFDGTGWTAPQPAVDTFYRVTATSESTRESILQQARGNLRSRQ